MTPMTVPNRPTKGALLPSVPSRLVPRIEVRASASECALERVVHRVGTTLLPLQGFAQNGSFERGLPSSARFAAP